MQQTERASTILLVDDDNVLRDVLGRVLTRDGYTVVAASGMAEALDVARDHTFSAGLLDLSLPDGDGVVLADALRASQADLPLILMTAYPIRIHEDPEIGRRFRRVMIKPLNLDELRQAVREALRGEPVAEAPAAYAPAETAAAASPSPPAGGGPRPPGRWQWLKSAVMATVALVVLAAFLVYISGVPIPGLAANAKEETASPPSPLAVDLVPDMPHTLFVPDDVKRALGIRKEEEDKDAHVKAAFDDVGVAKVPTETRPLVLTGSTALDPNEILHIRARFAPAKVVEIGSARLDPEHVGATGTQPRELRVGDRVQKGDLLGVFYSDAVGSQKNALFDNESQRRLDQEILDHARASNATVEQFLWNAERNVEADVNHINLAANTLRTWGIPEKDIQKIIDEAKASRGNNTLIAKEKYEDWGRVELRADMDGVLVERNIPKNELIQDPTVSLFQIAKVDHVHVIANASEEDLKTLVAKQRAGQSLFWSIQTVNGPEKDPVTGVDPLFPIDDIGYIVDPNQHSAVVKGYIPNPDGKMRGAQLVTAKIPLDPPDDVVEIDVSAVADDGSGNTFVFVQADERKSLYTLRRVKVTQRFDRTVYVKSKLDAKEAALTPAQKEHGLTPLEALHEGDKVLKSGVLELKAELEDRESGGGKDS